MWQSIVKFFGSTPKWLYVVLIFTVCIIAYGSYRHLTGIAEGKEQGLEEVQRLNLQLAEMVAKKKTDTVKVRVPIQLPSKQGTGLTQSLQLSQTLKDRIDSLLQENYNKDSLLFAAYEPMYLEKEDTLMRVTITAYPYFLERFIDYKIDFNPIWYERLTTNTTQTFVQDNHTSMDGVYLGLSASFPQSPHSLYLFVSFDYMILDKLRLSPRVSTIPECGIEVAYKLW
jgi:hypothetical protein